MLSAKAFRETLKCQEVVTFSFYIPSWLGKVGQKIPERPNTISKFWQAING